MDDNRKKNSRFALSNLRQINNELDSISKALDEKFTKNFKADRKTQNNNEIKCRDNQSNTRRDKTERDRIEEENAFLTNKIKKAEAQYERNRKNIENKKNFTNDFDININDPFEYGYKRQDEGRELEYGRCLFTYRRNSKK